MAIIELKFNGSILENSNAETVKGRFGSSFGLFKKDRVAIEGFEGSAHHVGIRVIEKGAKAQAGWTAATVNTAEGKMAILIDNTSFERRMGLTVEEFKAVSELVETLQNKKIDISKHELIQAFLIARNAPKVAGHRTVACGTRNVEIVNGKAYLHFSDKKDPLLGEGAEGKDIRYGLALQDQTLCAMILAWPDAAKREAKFLESVRGLPNVMQYHAIIPSSDPDNGVKALFIEPLYNRGTLADLPKDLPIAQKLNIAKQIADGLGAVHQKGIVHRDLNIGNIFIMQLPSGELVPYIADFGCSCYLENDTERKHLSGGGLYMAPEFAKAHNGGLPKEKWENANNLPLDVHSLGCIFHEWFIGNLPWQYNSDKQEENSPREATPIIAAIDKDWMAKPAIGEDNYLLRQLIWRMVRFDPNERISAADAAELFETIQYCLEAETSQPLTPTLAGPVESSDASA